jgi:hypothetical protein
MPQVAANNTSASAGDEKALSNPNSPESVARRAQESQAQASEDQRYDAPPPTKKAGFQDYIIVWEDDRKRSTEISSAIFLCLGVLLFLYKAAPDRL